MSDHLDEPVWDGNGGMLDPKVANDHDLLVAIHVKMDKVVIPRLTELTNHQAAQERGEFTRAQERSILDVVQIDRDAVANRRNLRMPVWALGISILALIPAVILAVVALSGGSL